MTNLTKAAQRVLRNAETREIPPRRELIRHSEVLHRLVKESMRTIDDLSALSEIPPTTIRGYIRGDRSPTLPKARKLVETLGADLDVFQVRTLPALGQKRRLFTVPVPGTDPILLDLVDIMTDLGMSNVEMFRRTGKHGESIREWLTGQSSPTLSSLDTCFAAVGYELRIVE